MSGVLIIALISLAVLASYFDSPIIGCTRRPMVAQFCLRGGGVRNISSVIFAVSRTGRLVCGTSSTTFNVHISAMFPIVSPGFIGVILSSAVSVNCTSAVFCSFSGPIGVTIATNSGTTSATRCAISIHIRRISPSAFV